MHQRPSSFLRRWLGVALYGVGVAAPSVLDAHEVPARVAVTAFVRAEGAVLRFVLRVPLASMRDVPFPIAEDATLDLAAVGPLLDEAARLWVAGYLRVWADGAALSTPQVVATRLSLPSDRSFATYAAAAAHFADPPLDPALRVPWQQLQLDVQLAVPISDPMARFAVEPTLGHLGQRTTSVLTLVLADGATRSFVYEGNPGRIELDPSAWRAARRFVVEGVRHILSGLDHLLFVFCLVLPVRRRRSLVMVVTAFTVAHSLTLGAAALGMVPTALWFPPLVETAIAASLVVLAIENVLLDEARLERRWRLAFAFGLIHGFGFSFALAEQLQFAGSHLVAALAAFNVGVELGQLAVVLAMLPVLHWLRTTVATARPRVLVVVGSVLVAHTAWHWMTARFATLAAYGTGFVWPSIDAAFALGLMRVALLGVVALAVGLILQQIFDRAYRV